MHVATSAIIQVCIPHTHRDYFDYQPCSQLAVIGSRVWVPFRNKNLMGVVVGVGAPDSPDRALKSIISLIDDTAFIPEELLTLCRWIGQYYLAPLSEVLALALPRYYRNGHAYTRPVINYYKLAMTADVAHQKISLKARKQHELIDFLAMHALCTQRVLVQAGFSMPQIAALLSCGVLQSASSFDAPIVEKTVANIPAVLNTEQEHAVRTIVNHLQEYRCFLLYGVTGSGKTEVYLQVIAAVLARGAQVLVLVPEIGLTPQLLQRFNARFQQPIAVIHSHLSDGERKKAWICAKERAVKIVIGTRAALFTPMPDLGLIVIDEEHDTSLKQLEGVYYSARDVALVRARARNIPVILGTATPSLESLHNCTQNKYTQLSLQQKALAKYPLHYQIVDLRNQVLDHGLASITLMKIAEHLRQQNQVLIFINRRGFAPVLLCHQCGWMADCAACDSHLTLHKRAAILQCHHCGVTEPIPLHCNACRGRELLPVGVGTQRIYEYLATVFPDTSIVRIDRDEVQKKHALDESLAKIHTGAAQLIIGTQMLAKGHHFPRLTLVVILEADNGFYNQDFRALERLGQLITQVAGRAGREELPGQVLIQTHVPEHPLLNQLIQQGYSQFANTLLAARKAACMPPYAHLAVIRAQSNTAAKPLQFLHEIKAILLQSSLVVLGPAPAPLARKSYQHRLQLLVKSSSRQQLNSGLCGMLSLVSNKKGRQNIRWSIDVDPIDLS